MTALGYRHLAGHVLAVVILILTFGFGVYSLSIDVAHHFLLIDALGKEAPSTLAAIPAMQPMAHYPRGSHWLAAGLGVLIGSPYAAMWLLSLLSVYAGYYALGRLAQLSGGYVALAAFALLLLILRSTGAMTGHLGADDRSALRRSCVDERCIFCRVSICSGLSALPS